MPYLGLHRFFIVNLAIALLGFALMPFIWVWERLAQLVSRLRRRGRYRPELSAQQVRDRQAGEYGIPRLPPVPQREKGGDGPSVTNGPDGN